MKSLDYFDYFRVLDACEGGALAVFTSPSCGACRAMLRALEDLGETLPVTAYRVAAEDNPGLVDELELTHLPALFLYRDGEPLGAVHAPPLPGPLLEALQEALLREPLG